MTDLYLYIDCEGWGSMYSRVVNGMVNVGVDLLCALAESGAGNRVLTSTDGVNWTVRTDPIVAAGILTSRAGTMKRRSDLDARLMSLPEIVVLCGSTRFYDEFQRANYDLTMEGKIVLSVGFYPHAKDRHGHGEGVGHDSSEKVALDELHKRKIDLADRVLVLNVGGYIGESTRGEIAYAIATGCPVDYMESVAG